MEHNEPNKNIRPTTKYGVRYAKELQFAEIFDQETNHTLTKVPFEWAQKLYNGELTAEEVVHLKFDHATRVSGTHKYKQ